MVTRSITTTTPMRTINELVLNYFITERCNYSCQFCFSRWDRNKVNESVPLSEQKLLFDKLYAFFRPGVGGSINPLAQHCKWRRVRINMSGGEPFLKKMAVIELSAYAKAVGFDVSITTNGRLIDDDAVHQVAPHISKLGFSIDSVDDETNRRIGRANGDGSVMTLGDFRRLMDMFHSINPKIKHKVNTVVGRYNVNEDFAPLVTILKPTKWTAVQLLPIFSKDIAVSTSQFDGFVKRHLKFKDVMIRETNDDYNESFLCINPDGRFFSNGQALATGRYKYSDRIVQVGVDKAFHQIGFSLDRYISRQERCSDLSYVASDK